MTCRGANGSMPVLVYSSFEYEYEWYTILLKINIELYLSLIKKLKYISKYFSILLFIKKI
jgi:hypothetical protein